MADPRVAKLALVLMRYSLRLKEGDLFRIATKANAAPLVRELYREALLVGAHPIVRISVEGIEELLYKYGSDAQLRYIPNVVRQEIEEMDANIQIIASENTKSLSHADPQKIAAHRQASQE